MVDPLPFNVVYDYGYDAIMQGFEDSLRTGLDALIFFWHMISGYLPMAMKIAAISGSGRRWLQGDG